MDTLPIPAQTLETYYHINGAQLERHSKEHLSDYYTWEQLPHAQDWLLFPENMGSRLSIDETSLSDGELYSLVTNKAAKGRKDPLSPLYLEQLQNRLSKCWNACPKNCSTGGRSNAGYGRFDV